MNNLAVVPDLMDGVVYHHEAKKKIEYIASSVSYLFAATNNDSHKKVKDPITGLKTYIRDLQSNVTLSNITTISEYLTKSGLTVSSQIDKHHYGTIKAMSQDGDLITIKTQPGEIIVTSKLALRPAQSKIGKLKNTIKKYPASFVIIILWFIAQLAFAVKFKSALIYDDDSQSLFAVITGVIPLLAIAIEDAVFSRHHENYRQHGNRPAFSTYLPRLLMAGTLMALSMGISLGITHSIGDGVAYGLMMGFFVPFMICAAVFFIIIYSAPIGFVFKTWRDKGENSFFFTGSGLLGILFWGPVTAVILNTKMVGSGQSRGIATLIMIPFVAIGAIPFPAEWVLVTRVSLIALLIVIIMAIVKKKTPVDKKININRLFIVTTFTGLAITIATTLWASYPIIVRAIIGLGELMQILLNLK